MLPAKGVDCFVFSRMFAERAGLFSYYSYYSVVAPGVGQVIRPSEGRQSWSESVALMQVFRIRSTSTGKCLQRFNKGYRLINCLPLNLGQPGWKLQLVLRSYSVSRESLKEVERNQYSNIM